jgi:hypothetical protein
VVSLRVYDDLVAERGRLAIAALDPPPVAVDGESYARPVHGLSASEEPADEALGQDLPVDSP